jgi:hypothetical protein
LPLLPGAVAASRGGHALSRCNDDPAKAAKVLGLTAAALKKRLEKLVTA